MKYAIAGLSAIALLSTVAPASADYHEHHRYGQVVHRTPRDYRIVVVGRDRYLYDSGCFYQYTPRGYTIVLPPHGAVVPVLPAGYRTVVIERRPYYVYDDVYYTTAPGGGYVVTDAPPANPVPVVEAAPAETKPAPIDSYEIQIPNDNGSYTLVVIKKTEKGFVGPQGEIYREHPTVEQLRDMYAPKKK